MFRHTIVLDLGFGDSGKGTIVDYLTKSDTTEPASLVARFNGGAQAGHNVVTNDGVHHTFSQFGSGTFNNVPTYLSEHVLVDPLRLASEALHLISVGVTRPFSLMNVNEECLVITPYHAEANRRREQRRGTGAHGTCGLGIGETVAYSIDFPLDALRVKDLRSRTLTEQKLSLMRDRLHRQVGVEGPEPQELLDVYEGFVRTVNVVTSDFLAQILNTGKVVFEGAQGVLLDESYGFHPHTTWSKTTNSNAVDLLANQSYETLGVIRSYMTRHGAGPMPTHDPLFFPMTEVHNKNDGAQGSFRSGPLDLGLIQYAIRATGGIDKLCVTHMDLNPGMFSYGYENMEIPEPPKVRLASVYQEALTYSLFEAKPLIEGGNLVKSIEEILNVPVVLTSSGPTARDKQAIQ